MICLVSLGLQPNLKMPVTARRAKREKRGSGGGSPRKYDDSLTGPSDLEVQSRQPPLLGDGGDGDGGGGGGVGSPQCNNESDGCYVAISRESIRLTDTLVLSPRYYYPHIIVYIQ
jgi:hypothetical protein